VKLSFFFILNFVFLVSTKQVIEVGLQRKLRIRASFVKYILFIV